MDNPIIKIFVSHRIDQESEIINNPVFINVRCGAVGDKRSLQQINGLLGDDTGDNISSKREMYGELTVQYWAWKNAEADYYGLCHYRRYISFSQNQFETNEDYNHVEEAIIDDTTCQKYNLNNVEEMTNLIVSHDIISTKPFIIKKDNKIISVYDSLKKNIGEFPKGVVDKYISLFKSKYPNYSKDIDVYFGQSYWQGFNCYVMKKEIFMEYSSILFDILFDLEKRIDMTFFSVSQKRILGYLGEITFAIYLSHILRVNKEIKHISQQLVKFLHPERKQKIFPAFTHNNIPVIVASSQEYAPFLSVLICSIRENTSSENNYDIIVLENEISDRSKYLLGELVQKSSNISIRFFESSTYLAGLSFHTAMHVTEMTYLRLAIPDILTSFDKIIYLDCDVVVNKDLATLFSTDTSECYVAGALDTIMAGFYGFDEKQIEYNVAEIGINNPITYINAGVLVMNLRKIRQDFEPGELISMAAQKNWKWFDQDVINKMFINHIKYLEIEWNVMVQPTAKETELTEFYSPVNIYYQYKEALRHPYIVHYAGHFIPCFAPNVTCAEIFWKYARQSPFYEYIISAMSLTISNRKIEEIDTRPIKQRILDHFVPRLSIRRKIISSLFNMKDV